MESPKTVRKGIIYKKEWSIDAAIHTNGYYLGFNKAKIKNFHTTTFFHTDLGFLYHPKETRSSRPNNVGLKSFNSYKFGKQNQLLSVRLGRGIIKTLSEKARTKGIAIGYRLEGGIDLGILKPYYLKVLDERDGSFRIKDIKYSDNPEDFLDPNHILGSSGFFRGITELSVIPGVYGRAAVRFDFGAFEKMIRCLEAGVQIDLYSKRPAIMINSLNPLQYINFYINLQLGKRQT
ncbi:MAG: hypothetical protein WBB21_01555 [Saprospiraceae bacterium]